MALASITQAAGRRSAAQVFALVSAAVYLGAGATGFAVTGLAGFAQAGAGQVIVLAVNPLHNIVHLTLGAGYLYGALEPRRAAQVNLAIGIGLLAAFVLGVAGGAEFLNITNVAVPDIWLHLAWGVASVYWGLPRAAATR